MDGKTMIWNAPVAEWSMSCCCLGCVIMGAQFCAVLELPPWARTAALPSLSGGIISARLRHGAQQPWGQFQATAAIEDVAHSMSGRDVYREFERRMDDCDQPRQLDCRVCQARVIVDTAVHAVSCTFFFELAQRPRHVHAVLANRQ